MDVQQSADPGFFSRLAGAVTRGTGEGVVGGVVGGAGGTVVAGPLGALIGGGGLGISGIVHGAIKGWNSGLW